MLLTRSILTRHRTGIVLCVTILAICAIGLAASRWRVPKPLPLLDRSSKTIVPGIHILSGLGPSAAYVVETADGLLLFDSGLEADAAPLKTQMASLGLDWREVRAVFLTHVHGDHCGGAAHLRKVTGAKIHAGRGDAPVLKTGGPKEAFFSTFYMPNHSPHPTPVDVELTGDEVFHFGDVQVQALATPGHTPGSVCYLVEKGTHRAFFSGDVIMQLGEERPVGTYSAYLAPRYRGDAKAFIPSLRKLRQIPVPDLLLPGHPFSDSTPQSPKITQARWESLLDNGIRDMETLLARYEADGADFLDGRPKPLLPDFYYLGDHHGIAVYGFFATSKFFLIGAPGPGLNEFLTTRFRQLGLKAVDPTAILLTSCEPELVSGLKELVEKTHAEVVAAPSGVESVKRLLSPDAKVVSSDDVSKKGWFTVTPLPLRGRGLAPIAYLLTWAGKTVLLSGKLPIMVDHDSLAALSSDLDTSPGNAIDYLGSINQLESVKPDLWLPSVPSDGQNANLYENEWKDVIGNNYRFIYERLARSLRSPLPKFSPIAEDRSRSSSIHSE